MKNYLTLLFVTFSFNLFSQQVNIGISAGTSLSTQSLMSESMGNVVGVDWNTIGGLPYRVDPYIGYNAGIILQLYFDLSSDGVDEKIIKRKISLKTGLNYSSQGVIVEDVNMTRYTNNLVYYQLPILIDFSIQKFNFFVGPQIHILQNFSTTEQKTTNLSSNATATAPNYTFDKNDFENNDTNLVYGIGYEVYDGLSIQLKSLRSLKNISKVDGEIWKNKSFELTANFIINSLL
ncbi:MAG: porin family protein [Bacteroidota bacterium]|nr:porin family protein [Bacteroidota bacterium]|tara:strand:+ start:1502 stop:2203 length:702 start_codon:yes stop_codon:yes gene_type:complete